MKKTKSAAIASFLAITTAISLCGCSAKPKGTASSLAGATSGIVSQDIFSDFEYMGKIKSVESTDISLSVKADDSFGLDAKVSVKGTDKLCQIDIPNLSVEISQGTASSESSEGDESTPAEPFTFAISNLSLIVDIENSNIYAKEESLRGILETLGRPVAEDFTPSAEWVLISNEDATTSTGSADSGTFDTSKITDFVTKTLVPEFKDAFTSSKDKFIGEDKHTIVLDDSNMPIFWDALLTMCDDGSITAIYDAANTAGLSISASTAEDFVTSVKTSIEEAKKGTAGSFKIKTNVQGDEGSLVADCTFTTEFSSDITMFDTPVKTSGKATIDLSIKEGTAQVDVPTSTVAVAEYMEAMGMNEVMPIAPDNSTSDYSTIE